MSAHAAVVINEILYTDWPGKPGSEWVELFNTSTDSVDVSDWILIDGGDHTYTNPPGTTIDGLGYLVMSKNTNSFHMTFPSVTNYVGSTGISFGSDDSIKIYDVLGYLQDEVTYYCATNGWPDARVGRSLELVYPFEDNTMPCFWKLSALNTPSPGARNPNSIGIYVVMHNRVPDGPTSADAPVISLQLGDIYGTVTSSTMYVNWGSGVYTPSQMSGMTNDYTITLPATNDGRQVRYYFRIRDNAGQLYQRWWRGTNEPYLYIVTDNPVTNGVIINEIMYHSSNAWSGGAYEYLEIFNARPDPVDVSYWLVKDENDKLRLPVVPVLSSGWYLVIADSTQAIRSVYGAPPPQSVLIQLSEMGLNNAGEHIRWQNANGVMVDEVAYNDKAPWPTAPDGEGPSLELISPVLDNALASSWAASANLGTPGWLNSVPEPVCAAVLAVLALAGITRRMAS